MPNYQYRTGSPLCPVMLSLNVILDFYATELFFSSFNTAKLLQDIHYEELRCIIEFIYHGEVRQFSLYNLIVFLPLHVSVYC